MTVMDYCWKLSHRVVKHFWVRNALGQMEFISMGSDEMFIHLSPILYDIMHGTVECIVLYNLNLWHVMISIMLLIIVR